MPSPLASLVQSGTKLWLDSVDPELVVSQRQWGATGATSNPIIISDLVKAGKLDAELTPLLSRADLDDAAAAWNLTDAVVSNAQRAFADVWRQTSGDDGYVSFELDPLLEDAACTLSVSEKIERYVELGAQWSAGHENRMIKVPATPGGLGALEELAARGVSLNVTLIFTLRQYAAARDAVWRGAQRRQSLARFKSVYSIFVSRVDVYADKHLPNLSAAARGQVGLTNAKRLWQANQRFWDERPTPLRQEIVFASTGVKNPAEPAWKYVAALAGSDIQTNPPATNDAVQASGRMFTRTVDHLPAPEVLAEIDRTLDVDHMERTLMAEGLLKFASPQHDLLSLIGRKRHGAT